MTFAVGGREASVVLFIGRDSYPLSPQLELICTQSGADAEHLLLSRQLNLQEIWIQSDAPAPGMLALISMARKCYPALPIRIIESTPEEALPESENQRLTLAGKLAPTGIAAQITALAAYKEQIAQLKSILRSLEHDLTQTDDPAQAGYVAVPLCEFAHQQTVHYDVYVRLPSGRFLHLLAAGESFTLERLLGYAEKGVRELYVRRESHEKSLAYADLLAKTLLTRDNIPHLCKLNHQLSHGEVLFSKIRSAGISEVHLEYAQTFVRGVQQSVKKLLVQKDLPRTFFRTLSGYEHAVSCALVASILALRLFPKALSSNATEGGTSGNEHDWIGLAAYLHDVGHYLDSKDSPYVELDPYHLENLAQFSPKERAQIEAHPLKGADRLARIAGIAPQVIDAVRNHHERRDQSGYPRKIPANQITSITEIVALSDEFVRALAHHQLDPDFHWQKHLETRVLPSFSQNVAKEFKEFFLAKANAV